MAEDIYHAGYLAEACHLAIGYVCHVYAAIEGQHVVLAQGIEIDVLDDDHLITSLLMEDGSSEYGHRVLIVTTGEVSHGACHSEGSSLQSFSIGVLAQEFQDSSYMLLNLLLCWC